MSLVVPQTPQKPLPGAFLNTPALKRQYSLTNGTQQASIFRSNSQLSQPQPQAQRQSAGNQQHQAPNQSQVKGQQNGTAGSGAASAAGGMSSVERGARTINTTLDEEGRYPPMENYITRWLPVRVISKHEADHVQRVILPITTFPLRQLGRRFKRSKCMISQIGYSNNTIAHKYRP